MHVIKPKLRKVKKNKNKNCVKNYIKNYIKINFQEYETKK